MTKIAIATDSNSGIDYYEHDSDIFVLRTVISFNDDSYLDGTMLKADDFYARLKKDKDTIPSTSAPSIGDAYKLIDELVEKGYTDIIYLPISFSLSSAGNTLKACQKDYMDKIRIHVIDTKTVGTLQLNLVLRAKLMADRGSSVDEIIDFVLEIISEQLSLLIVKDLRYFIKNGRLSGAAGIVSSLSRIKPVLHINDEGKILLLEKIRTYYKAIKRAIEIVSFEAQTHPLREYFIFYTDELDEAKKIASELSQAVGGKKIMLCQTSPSVGSHLGCGGIGIGYQGIPKI